MKTDWSPLDTAPELPFVAVEDGLLLQHAAGLGHRRNGLPERNYGYRAREHTREEYQQGLIDAVAERYAAKLAAFRAEMGE